MKKKFFNRVFSLILCFCIFVTSTSQAVLGTAAATSIITGVAGSAATTSAAVGTGAVVGYVGGGIGISAATFASTWHFLFNCLAAMGIAFNTDLDYVYDNCDYMIDAQSLELLSSFKQKNDLNMINDFEEIAGLKHIEIDGVEYDAFEFSGRAQEFLFNKYYGLETGTDIEVSYTPDVLIDNISSGFAVDSVGNTSALLPYDAETGKIHMPEITTNRILSTKGSLADETYLVVSRDFVGDSDLQFPITGYSFVGNDTARTQALVDYFVNKMYMVESAFTYFIDNNPIGCVISLPDEFLLDSTPENIDNWRKTTLETGGVDFKPLNYENCPTLNIYTEKYSGASYDVYLTTKCADCDIEPIYGNFDGIGYYAGDLYGAIGPSYSYDSETGNYSLNYVRFRLYSPVQYSGKNFYWSNEDYIITQTGMCDNCWNFYQSKFITTNANGNTVPALGCTAIDYSYTLNELNLPDFTDETKNYVLAVPSGSTYTDIANGDATVQWIDLNSASSVVDLGLVDSSQFENVEYIPDTGTIKHFETEVSSDGSDIEPDTPTDDSPTVDDDVVHQIQEWIQGGISFNPDVIGNVSIGSAEAFDSLGDAVSAGTSAGVQHSTIQQIINSLNSKLEPDSTGTVDQPNILDLFILLLRVLYACVCLIIRCLVFIATLVTIPASTELLNADVITGINYARSLTVGSINLFSLFGWFFNILFGISVIHFIRKHYHI